jgi:hypothetical protein
MRGRIILIPVVVLLCAGAFAWRHNQFSDEVAGWASATSTTGRT